MYEKESTEFEVALWHINKSNLINIVRFSFYSNSVKKARVIFAAATFQYRESEIHIQQYVLETLKCSEVLQRNKSHSNQSMVPYLETRSVNVHCYLEELRNAENTFYCPFSFLYF